MADKLSRFDNDPFEGHPGLGAKLKQALRSKKPTPVRLTQEEADYLIDEPDPDKPNEPTQMFSWLEGGILRAVVVRGGGDPRCWRL